jgi:hypothetical protein
MKSAYHIYGEEKGAQKRWSVHKLVCMEAFERRYGRWQMADEDP